MTDMYYDDIPVEFLGDRILEIGVSRTIMNSKIWPVIKNRRYTGIDAKIRDSELPLLLNVIEDDIIEHEFSDQFDTILAVNTFEHIHLWDWQKVIKKLVSVLKKNGYLVIVVPYKQKFSGYRGFPAILRHDRYALHHTFGIDEKIVNYYLEGARTRKSWKIVFRQDNASFPRALGRFLKRCFLYVFTDREIIRPVRRSMMITWQK